MKLQNINEFLSDIAMLYHSTEFNNVLSIISENILKSAVGRMKDNRFIIDKYVNKPFISFTRNSTVWAGPAKLVLNKTMLNSNYKLIMYDWYSNLYTSKHSAAFNDAEYLRSEAEERVYHKIGISNIIKYIIRIELNRTSLDNEFGIDLDARQTYISNLQQLIPNIPIIIVQ